MKFKSKQSINKVTWSSLRIIFQAVMSSTTWVAFLFAILIVPSNKMTEVHLDYERGPSSSKSLTLISSNVITYFLPVIFRIEPYWQEIGGSASGGGISNSSEESYTPLLTVAPDSKIYVAWEENKIIVKRWAGYSWEEVGTSPSEHPGLCYSPPTHSSLAIAPNGVPYVAWVQTVGMCFGQIGRTSLGDDLFVSRWNGSSWEEIAGYSSPVSSAYAVSLAIAPTGTPYIAWVPQQGSPDIYVKRWNGHNWEEVGSGSVGAGGIAPLDFELSLAIAPDGVPYVAWKNRIATPTYPTEDIYVRRWNGSNWSEVGTGSANGGGISRTGRAQQLSLAIASDGTPYVAWSDASNTYGEVYVRKWNGSNWVEIGAGSASGGGISNTSESSYGPSLKVKPTNNPCVAWTDTWSEGPISGNPSVYIRCWNGNSWSEVGSGSASGVGISNKDMTHSPSLDIAKDGTPYVAWQNLSVDPNGPDNWEIYVKGWFLTPPSTTKATKK